MEELVTSKLPSVARPELLKTVLQRLVLKKSVEVAAVVVAFEAVKLVAVEEALISVPATWAKAVDEICWRGERASYSRVVLLYTSTFRKTFVAEKS